MNMVSETFCPLSHSISNGKNKLFPNPGAAISPDFESDVDLKINELSASYGKNRVLNKITCRIPKKRITAIMGPSGCGKSTLLKTMNRTLELTPGARVTSGEVIFKKANIYGVKQNVMIIRQKIGIIHQRPVPFPMSIMENVLFGVRFKGRVRARAGAELTRFYLEQVGLWNEVKDRLHESASRLSGGQQQRLCLARTLANEPEVILMDEPCSALDPNATARVEELITALKERYTIIIVTHNMSQAQRVSDYSLFMYTGSLLEAGPTSEIFTSPAQQATRDFVSGKIG